MKVLFDLSSAQPQGNITVNGGGEYASKIFYEFIRRIKGISIEVVFNRNNGENSYLKALCEENCIKFHYFSSIDEFSNLIKLNSIEVLFLPVCYPKYYELALNEQVKVISVIHDLSSLSELKVLNNKGRILYFTPVHYLKKIKFELDKKKLIQKYTNQHTKLFSLAKKQLIITDSFYSKHAMNFYLPDKMDQEIHVIYPPKKKSEEFNTNEEKEILQQMGVISKEYFLLLSTDRWAKNNFRAIEALDDLLCSNNSPERLLNMKVLVLGARTKVKSYILNKIKAKDHFLIFDYLPTKDLEILYKNAHLFLYPSLLEGFGYPPIEAMKYNTLSACSVSTSIPEVCGDAVLYFNPYDLDNMKISIMQSFDDHYVQILRKKMRDHYIDVSEKQNEDLEYLFELVNKFIFD